MPSVTIRDIPIELHHALKDSAERNRRSLNAEIIWRLDNSVIRPIRKLSVEEIQAKADEIHEELRRSGFKPLSDEEIRNAIRQGRP
jgi:hypothetical protein